MTSIASVPVRVLVIEDDDVEIMAMERVLKAAKIPYALSVARDGVEALAALRGNGQTPAVRPDVVFLDLNMPRMNGLEFLREIRRRPEYTNLNIVVVTTSSAEEDRRAALRCQVSGYVVKSDYVGDFRAFAGKIASHVHNLMAIGEAKTALIVSDAEQAVSIREALGEGIEPLQVATIEEAFTRIRERTFDVLIVDARGRIDSIPTVLEFVRDLDLAVPLLFIADGEDDGIAARAVRDGAEAVLLGTNGLRSLRTAVICAFERWRARRALMGSIARLEHLAYIDPLTGAMNRRGFERALETELLRGRRRGSHQLKVLLVDCDQFKTVNDTHGYAIGDLVLREVSSRIRGELRAGDPVARIGGDEFLVLLPELTDAEANTLVERVRQAVAATPILAGELGIPQRVSAIVYPVPPDARTVTDVLRRAEPLRPGRRSTPELVA